VRIADQVNALVRRAIQRDEMARKIWRWMAELAREQIGDEEVGAIDFGDRDDVAQ